MREWLVVVNREAGRSATDPGMVSQALDVHGIDYEMVVPETRAAAAAALKDGAEAGHESFAVAGGDGTVNLAVNTLLDLGLESPLIGVLPTGTGCDLLRTFGLPQDLRKAAGHLGSDHTYPVDVVALEGSWGVRYFVNVAQVGVGAAAAETAPRISRRLGAARYPIAFAARLPLFPRAEVIVTTERRTYESEALAVIMANGQFFAGGWNVAPRATLMDGVVDVQVIDALKRRAPALVPKVIKGTHLSDRAVRRFSAATFIIETDPAWPLEADGDLVGNTPVSGRVVPAAIRLKI